MDERKFGRRSLLKQMGVAGLGLTASGLAGATYSVRKATAAQAKSIPKSPLKVAVVSFLTGPASGPFGVPGNNAFKLCADQINKEGGIAGRKIELKSYDEAGGTDSQVKLARKLILSEEVDVILGYISSADCKAILP
ncbi:MAG: ABC transporter substrate-binding protein, partial [Desulfobacterales bacterium]|nr:ABC transporter substrate-binding protein [Desulfobacterales bacterium]